MEGDASETVPAKPASASAAWKNPQFRRAAHILDSWTLVISLINNLLHLFMRWRNAGPYQTPTLHMAGLSILVAVYTLLQLALHRARPDVYYKHRYHILLLARLLRMCNMGEWVHQTRQWFAAPDSAQAAIDSYVSSSQALRPLSATLALLVFSGTLHSLAHAVTIPLPLPTQAAFHALYLALMLAHAPIAAHSLGLTPYRPALQHACAAINEGLVVALGQDPRLLQRLPALQRTCQHHSALVLVVFAQVYLGTLLPLLHSYRMQRDLCAALAEGQEAPAELEDCQQQPQQQAKGQQPKGQPSGWQGQQAPTEHDDCRQQVHATGQLGTGQLPVWQERDEGCEPRQQGATGGQRGEGQQAKAPVSVWQGVAAGGRAVQRPGKGRQGEGQGEAEGQRPGEGQGQGQALGQQGDERVSEGQEQGQESREGGQQAQQEAVGRARARALLVLLGSAAGCWLLAVLLCNVMVASAGTEAALECANPDVADIAAA